MSRRKMKNKRRRKNQMTNKRSLKRRRKMMMPEDKVEGGFNRTEVVMIQTLIRMMQLRLTTNLSPKKYAIYHPFLKLIWNTCLRKAR